MEYEITSVTVINSHMVMGLVILEVKFTYDVKDERVFKCIVCLDDGNLALTVFHSIEPETRIIKYSELKPIVQSAVVKELKKLYDELPERLRITLARELVV